MQLVTNIILNGLLRITSLFASYFLGFELYVQIVRLFAGDMQCSVWDVFSSQSKDYSRI